MSDRVGVMSHGRLQQVANPRDIYDSPANGFVASFVGENNILGGTVGNIGQGLATFETPIGVFRAKMDPNTPGAVKLYVRPEHMRFSETAGEVNSVPVTVGDVAFEGNFISVHAATENGTVLVAELRNDGTGAMPTPGAKMHMSFDPARAAILPDETAAAAAEA